MKQNRFNSWALWTALGALAAFCAKEFFHTDLDRTIEGLLNVLLPVLAAFGIVNDPTSKNSL